MKKILLSSVVLLLTIAVQAQRIESDLINPYNKRVILTSLEKVNWKSDDYKLEAGLMLEGTDMSMLLNWQCREMVGAERDAEVVLSFDDATQVILLNKVFSVSGRGKIASENVSPIAMGIQINAKGDINDLAIKELKSISINTTSGEIIFPLTKNEAVSLRKLYEVFEKQLYKESEK